MDTIRALVLSGGGGRGAFHAGVYKYLMERSKSGVDSSHIGEWDPQVVVGTSIGAVNGAAIAQDMPAEELERIWLGLREHHIQGIPPGMRGAALWFARKAFKEIMGVTLPQVPPEKATSPVPKDFWSPFPLFSRWWAEKMIGKWINLLDTGPLRETLLTTMHFDAGKVAASAKTLMIAATNVQSGERTIFSNKPIYDNVTHKERRDVVLGITVDRILASCSIPLVYPWTFDPGTNAFYWDGAVVANTPLGSALDAMQDMPIDIPAEVVVVLMTPWWDETDETPHAARQLPESFNDAITWTLDWALLASFRERLRLIDAYNEFAMQERAEGKTPYRYRPIKVVVVAPQEFLPAARIIDYDEEATRPLIQLGYDAAKRAFQEHFPG